METVGQTAMREESRRRATSAGSSGTRSRTAEPRKPRRIRSGEMEKGIKRREISDLRGCQGKTMRKVKGEVSIR